ncbi:MAG TPA: beta-propeller fold lactonase family protein [Anaerolineae bacterium]|nr:beta-propeller fold lactonase family protein [Anaerolineae bacterium]
MNIRRNIGRILWLLLSLLFLVVAPASAIFLVPVEVQRDGVNGVDGLSGAHSVTVSPDGRHVYVTGFNDRAIAVFRRAADGRLTFVEAKKDGVEGITGLAGVFMAIVSPDGRHVYVTGSGDDALALFNRDATTGRLAFVEVQIDGVGGVDGLDGASAVTISPDGRHVYAAGFGDNALAVFRRNAVTGRLTFAGIAQDGQNGADGLAGAYALSVSPDGRHVYAAGLTGDAVAVFRRNSRTGALRFVEVEKDGVDGIDGLDGAYGVSLSPNGKHVYVPSLVDDAVVVFSRNSASGALTFVETERDGVDGVDGLDSAFAVAVNPDGRRVYVASYADSAVAVFERDDTTGALTFVEVHTASADLDALDGAISVAVSPDGRYLYVAGFGDNAVSVFNIPIISFYLPVTVKTGI